MIRPAPRRQPPQGQAQPTRQRTNARGAAIRTPRAPRSPRSHGLGAPRRETDIVRAILDYLALCPGVVAWRVNTGMAMLHGRGGKLQPVRFGVKGMADIIGWVEVCRLCQFSPPRENCYRAFSVLPSFVALEVKTETGVVRPAQAAFLEQVRQAGGIGAVVRSVADVQKALGR